MTKPLSGAGAASTSVRAVGSFFAGSFSDARGVVVPVLQAAGTEEVWESFVEGVLMGERTEASLTEGRVVAGRVEALLEDGAFLGGEELTVDVRTPLDIEVSEVSLGAPLRDGVEVSLEVSVAGAFLQDGTAVTSFGAV